MIKQLLAGAALSVAAQGSMAFYVLGDSVSAWKDSWPQVMREQYGSWIRADVQSGRALVSYDASADLAGIDGHGHLGILALGFNDGTYVHNDLTTAEDYGIALRNTVNNWRNADYPFRKVIIVIPPNTRLSEKAHDDVRFQAQLYCALMIHYWSQEWLHCVDWDAIGYYDNTRDGIHPTRSFSRDMAAHMYNEINNFAPEAL